LVKAPPPSEADGGPEADEPADSMIADVDPEDARRIEELIDLLAQAACPRQD
jgi:hypothetical protein